VRLIVPELAVMETVFVLRRRLHEHEKTLKDLPALLRAAGVQAELGTAFVLRIMRVFGEPMTPPVTRSR
jgi:hypothetical protein